MSGQPLRVLCMDIGTSSIKAGLLDERGNLLWFYHDPILADKALLMSWDPVIWLRSFRGIIEAFKRDLPDEKLAGLALSGNGPTLVPVDAAGQPTGPALLWIDPRRENRAGNRSFYLPKIAWFRQQFPREFAQTAQFLSCPEYLNFVLTGQAFTIAPTEDFKPYIWSQLDIDRFGLDPALLPEFRPVASAYGQVTAQAAADFGLPAGLPVFSAGSDFMMSLAGTATLSPGDVCDRAGSSEGINYCFDKEIISPKLRTLPHLSPGCWNMAGILASTGLMFEWFRGITGQGQRSYQSMLEEIRALPVNANLPWFVPNQREATSWEFQQGMFLNLKPEHSSAHLGRAVVESIGFAVRQTVENLAQAGLPVREMRLCGGQAKNPLWVAMKADITGVSLLVPQVPDAELVGNAMMAMVGLGVYGSIKQAALAMVRMAGRVDPNPETHAAFTRRYADYRDLQDHLAASLPGV